VPFTIAHAAAVLPLQRFGRFTLPLSALMVGSMAPDFGYFFSFQAPREITHSFTGLLIFALPVGLAVWLFYVAVLEKATITLLSDRWHTRFAHTDAIRPALVARAAFAILLGAVTHLLWDAFTHRGTFLTRAFPVLLDPVPVASWMPIYHLLHGLSSIAGVVILVNWAQRLHRQPAKSLIRPYAISEWARIRALWFLGTATVFGGLVQWLPHVRGYYDAQLFSAAVGLMSGFFVGWCVVAVGFWVHARRSRAR